jgi:hypothetical protein
MRRVYLTFAIVLTASACLAQIQQPKQHAAATVAAQEPSTDSQGRASVSAGDRTIVGCVAMGAPGYVLKTDDGNTFPLRSMTDMAPYVGKKVQIHATWRATGIHLAGPIEGTSGATPAAGGGPKTASDFAGDLHLQLQGKVIGDCLGKK